MEHRDVCATLTDLQKYHISAYIELFLSVLELDGCLPRHISEILCI
jgi:hypothetical protein